MSRPPKTMTGGDWEELRRVNRLTLHRMLLLGLGDAVPNPSPMSEEAGAWVRRHAFSADAQIIESGYPRGFFRWTHCEKGRCWNCLNRRCDLCVHRQQGGPNVDEDTEPVYGPRGVVARFLPRPDGRPCVWWCRCPCPKGGPALDRPSTARAGRQSARIPDQPRRTPSVPLPEALFDLKGTP